MKRHVKIEPYWGPVGGWGSARAVSEILLREGRPVEGTVPLAEQNKPSGFACVSCSYDVIFCFIARDVSLQLVTGLTK
jgi:hypothetical protein